MPIFFFFFFLRAESPPLYSEEFMAEEFLGSFSIESSCFEENGANEDDSESEHVDWTVEVAVFNL